MQRPGRNACLLLLASSGLLPAGGALAEQDPLDGPGSHHERLGRALVQAERTLQLERFMLKKLEQIRDPGISPSYPEELEAARTRVLEAQAWVMALQRARDELHALLGPTREDAAAAPSPDAP